MRLFGIAPEGQFKEYVETSFQAEHEESVLEEWLQNHPEGIVEDGKLLIIGRQVRTNLGGIVDLLALDKQGNVAVIELKRDRTPRETLAQAFQYASYVEQLTLEELEDIFCAYTGGEPVNLPHYHREYFELAEDEAVALNKDQRIVIVGQRITPEIRQTAAFMRKKHLDVTCVEFSFFESEERKRLLSNEIVVGKEAMKPITPVSASRPKTSLEKFTASLDQYGKAVFERILDFAKANSLPVKWGTRGFSLNVDLGGTDAAICYGFPPNKQSIYTVFFGRRGFLNKVQLPEGAIKNLFGQAQATGLFGRAGRELKCSINREFSEPEISSLLSWVVKLAETVREHWLKGDDDDTG